MCQREGQNWLQLHPGQVPRSSRTVRRSGEPSNSPSPGHPTLAPQDVSQDTGLEGQLPYVLLCHSPAWESGDPASPWKAGATPLQLPRTLTLSELFPLQVCHCSYRTWRLQ